MDFGSFGMDKANGLLIASGALPATQGKLNEYASNKTGKHSLIKYMKTIGIAQCGDDRDSNVQQTNSKETAKKPLKINY